MRIIISPAKKMRADSDSLPWLDLPAHLSRTELLAATMQSMSASDLKKLWRCNDAIAKLNVSRLQNLDLRKNLTPAILSYEGIQYQYMAPGVFSDREFTYVQEHLRILSGFYGVLKPFDGVVPYRLEMQAKLSVDGTENLYDFWGSTLSETLLSETDTIVNLASKEYSLAVSKHLPISARFISCVFGECIGGKVVEKGTLCKMARGDFVRFLAEQQITDPEEFQTYSRLGYQFSSKFSDSSKIVFLRKDA